MSENQATPAKSPEKASRISFQKAQQALIFILILVLCGISAFYIDTFFTTGNLIDNLLRNAVAWGIVACGMTLVMIGGGFDLSVASNTAVCCVTMVLTLQGLEASGPAVAIPAAIAVALLTGTLLGAFNGVLIAYVRVNPFVVTLSTMLIFRGIALVLTKGGLSLRVPLPLLDLVGTFYWGYASFTGLEQYRISIPILLFLIVFVAAIYLLRFTRLGHYIYALGGNEDAAWLAGVNTQLVKATTYTLCGTTCAVAAVILIGTTTTAEASSFMGAELLVIASVIVGGTPLGGGSGGMFATLGGILLLGVIENLLTQFGIHEEYRNIIRGLIILVVVSIDVLVRGKKTK